MEAAEEIVVLTVVSGETEAEIVCGLLRSAGIKCGYRDTEAIETTLEDFGPGDRGPAPGGEAAGLRQ